MSFNSICIIGFSYYNNMHIWYFGLTPADNNKSSLRRFLGFPDVENRGHCSSTRKESPVKYSREHNAHYLPLHHIEGYNVWDVVDTHCNAPIHQVNSSCWISQGPVNRIILRAPLWCENVHLPCMQKLLIFSFATALYCHQACINSHSHYIYKQLLQTITKNMSGLNFLFHERILLLMTF